MIEDIDKRYFLQVSPTQDIGYIKPTDISKSCDICGEGKSYGREYRLHLYMKSSYEIPAVKCFNCGYSSNLYGYLKENHSSEFMNYMKEKRDETFNDLTTIKDSYNDLEISKETKEIIEIPIIKQNTLLEPFNLIDPIPNLSKLNEASISYLKGRGLEPKDDWLYAEKGTKFMFNDVEIYLNDYIIVPLTYKNKWYGFQAIGYIEKRFFVYLLDGNDGYKVWNWFNINPNEPVYIFESIYDAMSSGLDNVIAQLGSSLGEDRLKELKEPIFVLDNHNIDETANRETLNYIKAGYKVFIWSTKIPLKFKDTNDLLKAGVNMDKIKKLILGNIFQGFEAEVRLGL